MVYGSGRQKILITANLPKLKIVKYKDLLLVDKLVCFFNRLEYGIRVWGEYRVEYNTILILDGMPPEVQLSIVGYHECRHFLGGCDGDSGMYNKEVEEKYLQSNTRLYGLFAGFVVFIALPLYLIGQLSRGFQIGILKKRVYLEEKEIQ